METLLEGDVLFIRMFEDEEYLECIKAAFASAGRPSGVVLSSVGQLKDFSLGYFVGKGDYSPERYKVPHELLSVSGIISIHPWGVETHLHACMGDADKRAVGGHLLTGRVSITNETVILLTGAFVERPRDERTGLRSLRLPGPGRPNTSAG